MGRCPDCGAAMADESSDCRECGATVADERVGRREERSEDGGETERRERRGDSRRTQQVSPADGALANDRGVSRRALLTGAGGLAVMGIAGGGYLGYRELFADESGPEATTREFLTAIGEGDSETARSLVHPDNADAFSLDGSDSDEQISVSEVREVPDEYDSASDPDVTMVEADLTATGEGQVVDGTYVVELRKDDGDWKVWILWPESADRPGEMTPERGDPAAVFTFDWDGGIDSPGPLTITHDGGDSIAAARLVVRGSNPAADNLGESWDTYDGETGPDDEVVAGSSVTLDPVASDANVSVVWRSEDGSQTSTLSDWTGPDA